MIRRPLSALRLTWNSIAVEPRLPSFTFVPTIRTEGASSSSRIVPVPPAVPIVAFAAFERVSTTVSSGSSSVSPLTETETVLPVSPGSKVRVPAVRAV